MLAALAAGGAGRQRREFGLLLGPVTVSRLLFALLLDGGHNVVLG